MNRKREAPQLPRPSHYPCSGFWGRSPNAHCESAPQIRVGATQGGVIRRNGPLSWALELIVLIVRAIVAGCSDLHNLVLENLPCSLLALRPRLDLPYFWFGDRSQLVMCYPPHAQRMAWRSVAGRVSTAVSAALDAYLFLEPGGTFRVTHHITVTSWSWRSSR